jgi:hypothetical protein
MKKKILISASITGFAIALLSGCGQAAANVNQPTQIAPKTSPASSPGSLVEAVTNFEVVPSGVIQDGLPLKVTQPADAATLNSSSITVKGQTKPGVTVYVNDVLDVADDGGNFSAAIILDDGPCAIDVLAMDESGNQAETILLVNVVSGG